MADKKTEQTEKGAAGSCPSAMTGYTPKRKYARYPVIFGKLDLSGLVDVARNKGMQVITAYKPDMHVCAEIGLYGTPQAMKSTEDEWKAKGHKLKSARRKSLVFGVNLNIPKAEWAEHQFEAVGV